MSRQGRRGRRGSAARAGAAALTAALGLAAGAVPQGPQSPAGALAVLRADLARDAGQPPKKRLARLHEFFARHRDDPNHVAVLSARVLCGSLHLERLDAAAAREEFRIALQRAPGEEVELRARARYGLHQAALLAGDQRTAKEHLERLLENEPGAGIAANAKAALHRLEHPAPSKPGDAMPPLQLGRDVQGELVDPIRLQGAPFLLVFFSVHHEPSRRELEKLATAWGAGGYPAKALVAFAVEDDPVELRRLAESRGFEFPLLTGADGFLHADWLACGVTGVPTSILVGADGRLVARDLGPDRLEQFLKQ